MASEGSISAMLARLFSPERVATLDLDPPKTANDRVKDAFGAANSAIRAGDFDPEGHALLAAYAPARNPGGLIKTQTPNRRVAGTFLDVDDAIREGIFDPVGRNGLLPMS